MFLLGDECSEVDVAVVDGVSARVADVPGESEGNCELVSGEADVVILDVGYEGELCFGG